MVKKIFGEFAYFKSQPHNVKTLIITNMLYAMILPIIQIFAAAYIMRNTEKSSYVIIFQLFMYVGVVLAAIFNGLLLRVFKSKTLYSFGILVSAFALMGMMFLKAVSITSLSTAGFAIGLSTGFFWTNRYLLTLNSTTDDNRNYFFGMESFFFTMWNILIPIAIGAFLGSISANSHFFNHVISVNTGYQIITVVALIIAIFACIVLSKGNFKNPDSTNSFHFKFHILWKKFLGLAALYGMVQGYLVTAPSILIMKFVGQEGSLGLIQGIGGAITAVLVYILGRVTKPKDRLRVFGLGLLIFFVGTFLNGVMFSAVGVILFVLANVLFQPLHDLAYFPIEMKTIDAVKAIEKRNEYTYIMSHEFGLFFGRALGMILFISLASWISETFALRYALLIVAAIQLVSLPLAKNINNDIDTKYSNTIK